ncbi:MAG: hypothetical protein JNL57_00245 [Bacteroidetes bacterium]|nr:hypothetical protein [Bacteroidota bacterium]
MTVCPDIVETYTATGSGCVIGSVCQEIRNSSITSTKTSSESYDFSIIGGAVINVTAGIAKIQWNTNCPPSTFPGAKPKLTVTYRCTTFTQRILESNNGTVVTADCDITVTTKTASIEPTIICVKITESPLQVAIDCCNDPSEQYNLEFETYGISSSAGLEVEWPSGIEQDGLTVISSNGNYKKWNLSFHTTTFGNSGTAKITAKSPCGTAYNSSVNVPINRHYKDPTWNPLPNSLCLGNSYNHCLTFDGDCFTVSWVVYRYDENGNLLSTSNPVVQTSGFCFLAVSSPTINSCNEYMKVEASVSSPCLAAPKIYSWTIKTPATAPGAGTSPVPNSPTIICPCISTLNFYASTDCATDMVEWYVTNDPNNTWSQPATLGINSSFQISFCSPYLFGSNPLPTGPFQDITIKWRRHNSCGWGPWGQSIIPAGYFYPAGSEQCPLTN